MSWLDRVILGPLRAAGPLSAKERVGYLVWGPIALVIGVTEILAALSKSMKNAIPWPTISSTIGHLEARHHWVSVVVVATIAMVAFHAVAYPKGERTAGGRAKRITGG
jgi:hypothetical protein